MCLIFVGGTPTPVAAPPEVALEEVTYGYVPWSMSSMVPCAPSNNTDFPSSSARFNSSAVSQMYPRIFSPRSEEHTSELQSQSNLVCRLLLEKKNRAFAFRLSARAAVTLAADLWSPLLDRSR